MEISLFHVIWVVYGIAMFLLLRYAMRREKEMLSEWRSLENESFRILKITSAESRYSVSGLTAQTVDFTEERRNSDGSKGITVRRILCNESGEYFFWHWRSDGEQFAKHIPHLNAKTILKDRYIAPL